MKNIKDKFQIPIATVVLLLGVAVGKVWAVSSWVTTVDLRLSRIEEKLGIEPVRAARKHLNSDLFSTAEAEE